MIKLKNVSKYYNNNGVVTLGLRNVNLELFKNEIVAITGESGSGKSTLLNVICGVDSYEEGEILFKENETSYFNQNDMDIYRKKHISFIYQNYNIIDSYTVLENIMLPLLIGGLSHKEAKNRAIELIQRVGLEARIKNRGVQLSGGEKQRCVIARALATDCEILACDEPTGNLDSKTGEEIIQLIKEVSKDKLVLIVTHNYEQVESIVTRTIKVSDGEIIEDEKKSVVEEIEIKEELDLSSDKIKLNTISCISARNIKSTPKKTIFSLLVFMAFSAIAFFLYLSAFQVGEVSSSRWSGGYKNYLSNRIVVYDKDHNSIDKDKLSDIKGIIYENAYYEDVLQTVNLATTPGGTSLKATVSRYMPNKVDNQVGEKPTKSGEVFMLVPAEELTLMSRLSSALGTSVEIGGQSQIITGYGLSKDIFYPLIVTYDDLSLSLNSSFLLDNTTDTVSITLDGTSYSYEVVKPTVNSEKTLIQWYSKTKPSNVEISVLVNDFYTVNLTEDNFNWIYTDLEEESVHIQLGYDATKFNDYEIVVYANNMNQAIRIIEDAGYLYEIPSSYGEPSHLDKLLSGLYISLVTIALFLLVFVTYVVLSRVYASKTQDYTIMRSMGIIKKDMSKMVIMETILIGFCANLLTIFIFYCCSIGSAYLKVLLSYNTIGFTVSYLLVMLFFEYFVAKRFNKRLFKFSVRSTINSEVSQHD